jgi:hypothetical protein
MAVSFPEGLFFRLLVIGTVAIDFTDTLYKTNAGKEYFPRLLHNMLLL